MNHPSPERWQRIEALLHRALDAEPARRAALLQRECGDDSALRAEVETLLAASAADSVLSEAIGLHGPTLTGAATELPAGSRLGPWRIEALVGRGGMGEVYRAERADGEYQQTVAIKVLRAEAAAHLDRFHTERRILARLEHPGIARLLDSATSPDGRPAMVMEWVAGLSLSEHCRLHRSSLAERLALFRQVSEAVAYAHAHLVIHRDLKPGNILVGADGRVKLLDFGIAKLLDPGAWNETAQTETQLAPLTPGHAAPEQLQGLPVTTATDIHALGVVLYELLSGQPPWRLANLPVSVALHKLLSEAPAPLSEAAAQNPQPPVPARQLAGDLDAILAKTLRKDPRERYATVAALIADLDRHLAGEPVAARQGGEWYRVGKFLRRNRLAVAVAGLVLAMAAGFVWQLARAERRAQQEAAAARQVTDYLVSLFEAADPDRTGGQPIEPRLLIDTGRKKLDEDLREQPQLRARLLGTLGHLYQLIGLNEEAKASLDEALQLQAATGLDDPAQAATLWYELGTAHDALNEYQAAIAAFQKSLALRRGGADEDAELVNDTLTSLGLIQQRAGDVKGGIAHLEQALARYRAQGNRAGQADALTYLSESYQMDGRNAEALQAIDQALALQKAEVGEAHPDYWRILGFKSSQLYLSGDYRPAEQAARTTLAGYQKVFGADAAPTNNIRYRLATTLYGQGRLGEALAVMQATADSERRSTGGDNPSFAQTLNELGLYQLVQGDLPAARRTLEESRRIWLSSEDRDSRFANGNRLTLARCLLAQGQRAAAQALLAAEIPAALTGSRADVERGRRELLLAELALAENAPDAEVQAHQQRALTLLTPEHRAREDVARGQSRLLLRAGRADAAEAALRAQIDRLAAKDDAQAPWLIALRLDLAEALLAQRRRAEAAELLRGLAPLMATALSEFSPEHARLRRLLTQAGS